MKKTLTAVGIALTLAAVAAPAGKTWTGTPTAAAVVPSGKTWTHAPTA